MFLVKRSSEAYNLHILREEEINDIFLSDYNLHILRRRGKLHFKESSASLQFTHFT